MVLIVVTSSDCYVATMDFEMVIERRICVGWQKRTVILSVGKWSEYF